MEIYYCFHLLMLCACVFEIKSSKTTKKYVMLSLMIVTIIFGGLRWKVGGDWYQYLEHFQYSNWSNIFSYQRRADGTMLEPLFVFINVLIKTIFGTFWMYNVCVVSFIQIVYYKLSWKFFPQHPLLFYSFLMILIPNYFPVRAGLSIGVSYLAYIYLYERKIVKYLIVIFAAFMIHKQCIVIFPLFWVAYFRKWLTIPSFIALFAAFALLGAVLQDWTVLLSSSIGGDTGDLAYHYTQYQNEGHSQRLNSYVGWGLNFFFLLVYLFVMKKENKDKDRWYITMLIAFILYNGITMAFTEGMGELARLSRLFVLAQVYLFVNAMVYFLSKKRTTHIKYFAVLFFVLYYFYRISQVGKGFYFEMTCLPYKTIFDYFLI